MGKWSEENLSKAGERLVQSIGMAILRFGFWMEEEMTNGVTIKEIRIQGPAHTGEGFRIIIKGVAEGRKFVGFHTAETLDGVLTGLRGRMDRNELAWRNDTPFGEASTPAEL